MPLLIAPPLSNTFNDLLTRTDLVSRIDTRAHTTANPGWLGLNQ